MDERRNNLLKEIVETYIKTVKPVGSKALCDKFGCSSATIRNEMAVLENLGYIEKNHISLNVQAQTSRRVARGRSGIPNLPVCRYFPCHMEDLRI